MTFLSSLIGALVGGLAGAAAWIGLTHIFGINAGWMALLIGILVGGGARAAIPQGSGLARGAGVAAALAMLLTLAGVSVGSAWLYVRTHRTDSEALAIARFARDTLVTWAGQNRALDWDAISPEIIKGLPVLVSDDGNPLQDHFPAEVWQRAEASWRALSAGQREECRIYPGIHCRTDLIRVLADAELQEHERRGIPVLNPLMDDGQAYLASNGYPVDIWSSASRAFDQMSEKDLAEFVALIRPRWNLNQQAEEQALILTVLVERFSPLHIMWHMLGFALAVGIAGRRLVGREWEADSAYAAPAVRGGRRRGPGGTGSADSATAPRAATGFVFFEHRGEQDGPSLLAAAATPSPPPTDVDNSEAGETEPVIDPSSSPRSGTTEAPDGPRFFMPSSMSEEAQPEAAIDIRSAAASKAEKRPNDHDHDHDHDDDDEEHRSPLESAA